MFDVLHCHQVVSAQKAVIFYFKKENQFGNIGMFKVFLLIKINV